jgi:hypothetical protein
MDWFSAVNGYCERGGPGLWAEPLNAVSNASFLVAAWFAWALARDRADRGGQALALILAAIGIGSTLFHTVAQVWAVFADVVPIQIFILVYLALATIRLFGAPAWAGVAAAIAFIPASALLAAAIRAGFGPLNGSTGYLPVPLLILLYAVALRTRAPDAARGLALGAGLLALSLLFRTVDRAACPLVPFGTHFLWHLLNGAMLWWMIRVLVLARAPAPAAGRP